MGATVAVVGAAKAERVPEAVARARELLHSGGGVPLTVVDGDEQLHAVVDHAERVVVLGGDGSVHRVVQRLADTGRTDSAPGPEVALVPMGTGNDLARGLGIPLDLDEAVGLALRGRPRSLALLQDEDGGVVVNAVHIGVGARAARTAEDTRAGKSLLGRSAYGVAAVLAGLRARGWHLRVTADGEVLQDASEPVLMVAVGLGRTIGGGAPVTPAADPFSATAEVTVSRSTGWLSRVGYAAALRQGSHDHRRDVTTAHAHAQVQVQVVRGDGVSTDADGEVAGPFRQRTWRVRADAWRLVLPS